MKQGTGRDRRVDRAIPGKDRFESVRRSARSIKWFVLALLLVSVLSAVGVRAQNDEILVIVNPDVSDIDVGLSEINKIFMGTKKSLNGSFINKLAFLKDGSTHQLFMKRIIGRSDVSFRNYWKRRVFTGKNPMPRYFSNETSVVKYVQANKNAIGYISASTPHKGVTVIRTLK